MRACSEVIDTINADVGHEELRIKRQNKKLPWGSLGEPFLPLHSLVVTATRSRDAVYIPTPAQSGRVRPWPFILLPSLFSFSHHDDLIAQHDEHDDLDDHQLDYRSYCTLTLFIQKYNACVYA